MCYSVAADDAKVGLRDEADVEKQREAALAKLETPLEKMKIKDLKQLLQERGVTCTACSEKSQLVSSVRENIHLPAKKEHLKKFANMPQQAEDEEIQGILKQMKEKQANEKKMMDALKAQGIDTSGMNFGGGMGGLSPEQLANLMKDAPK